MSVNTGMGGSRIKKDADTKGLYIDPGQFVPGSGIEFVYAKVVEAADLTADPNNVPYGTKVSTQIKVQTTGYTGTVTISGAGGAKTDIEYYGGIVVNVTQYY
jgi:hypothetical protein